MSVIYNNNRRKNKMEEFKRNCPCCNVELTYKSKAAMTRANKVNGHCRKCGISRGKKLAKENKTKKIPIHILRLHDLYDELSGQV